MDEVVKKLLASLNWHRPQSEQDFAVQELIHYKDEIINIFISETQKEQWHNAIRIIERLDNLDQLKAVPQMLLLLMDMNWPGAQPAVEIMKKLDLESIRPYVEEVLIRAENEKDTIWIAWIKYLIEQMNAENDFDKYLHILNKAEW
ncbi:DUF5071 domain-containing protein [Paenibacillus sp. strain BS8-2]